MANFSTSVHLKLKSDHVWLPQPTLTTSTSLKKWNSFRLSSTVFHTITFRPSDSKESVTIVPQTSSSHVPGSQTWPSSFSCFHFLQQWFIHTLLWLIPGLALQPWPAALARRQWLLPSFHVVDLHSCPLPVTYPPSQETVSPPATLLYPIGPQVLRLSTQ